MKEIRHTDKTRPSKKPGAAGVTPGTGGRGVQLPLKIEAAAIALVLLAALSMLYPEVVFQNKIFLARDVEAAISFARAAHRVMIDEHIYPLWNPYLFSGMPSYESLAYNPYVYPLSFITGFLITKLHFPENSWLLFHAFLLGLGVYLLLRDRKAGFIPSALAAVFMMWMPNLVAIGVNGHGSQACAVAYMPYALLFWDRLTRGKGIVLNGSALAIILGFQVLRGHLQISYYTYAMIGLHLLFYSVLAAVDAFKRREPEERLLPSLFRTIRPEKSGASIGIAAAKIGVLAGVLAAVVGFSLLISSVLYVPVHEYAGYSIRGASESGGLDYEYATSWSLHPIESLTFLVPFSFGFGKDPYYGYMPFTDYPNYLGFLVFMGCCAAVWLKRTRFVIFLVFLVLVSTLVAFGKHMPVFYDPLFKWMPYFNKFRVPVMVLIVQQLACVLLFAFGFAAVLNLENTRGRKLALRGLAIFAALLVLVAISQGFWKEGFARDIANRIRASDSAQEQLRLARFSGGLLLGDLVKLTLLGCAVFGLLLLYFRKLLSRNVAVMLIVLAGLADVYLVDRYITHPEKFLRSDKLRILHDARVIDDYLKPDPVIDFLRKDTGFYRILPFFHPSAPLYGDFTSNRFMNFGISSIGGYHAAKFERYNNFLKSLGPALAGGRFQVLDMLNMRYIVAAYPLPEIAAYRPVWTGVNHEGQKRYIYENSNAFPRVFFVDRYETAKGEQALRALMNASIDLSKVAILEKRPALEPVSGEGSEARITKFGFNEIHVEATVASPCIMVLSEIYYPRWKVTVDGTAGEVLQADYLLRAVALPAGDHRIVFEYDASHIQRYFMVSLATFIVLLTALLVSGGMRSKAVWKRSS